MTSIKDQIRDRIRLHGKGNWVFSACDFRDIADQTVVNDALARLSKSNQIRRLGSGFYDDPSWSLLMQSYTTASNDLIVDALARKNNYQILMDDLMAANILGLTNAVSGQIVYYANTPSKEIKIFGKVITLRFGGKKRMYWANRKGAIAIQAMWWLGKDILQYDRDKIVTRLRKILPDAVKEDLLQGFRMKKTPSWMKDVILSL